MLQVFERDSMSRWNWIKLKTTKPSKHCSEWGRTKIDIQKPHQSRENNSWVAWDENFSTWYKYRIQVRDTKHRYDDGVSNMSKSHCTLHIRWFGGHWCASYVIRATQWREQSIEFLIENYSEQQEWRVRKLVFQASLNWSPHIKYV